MKRFEDKERLKNVIQSDRTTFTNDILGLILDDFTEVFKEYFCLSDKPVIEIKRVGEEYDIILRARAETLRSFKKVI